MIFDKFVAPYDAPLIDLLHGAGMRVVYHTCGGMMPLLGLIADMKPDAMETFTPPAMGGHEFRWRRNGASANEYA